MMDIPVFQLVQRSGPAALSILAMLGLLSLLSWSVVLNRYFHFRSLRLRNRRYLRQVAHAERLAELVPPDRADSLLGELAGACIGEYGRILEDFRTRRGTGDGSLYLQGRMRRASGNLAAAADRLTSGLDSGLLVLAVTSSIAPFLGLLGTVWGIMNSFYQIGSQGSASLPVVAPGIAEALITTIVGLVVAIPASFFYNILNGSVRRLEKDVDEFGNILLEKLEADAAAQVFAR